jgi:hypothetical protein
VGSTRATLRGSPAAATSIIHAFVSKGSATRRAFKDPANVQNALAAFEPTAGLSIFSPCEGD